jgi:chaperonin cofactor prefoldin
MEPSGWVISQAAPQELESLRTKKAELKSQLQVLQQQQAKQTEELAKLKEEINKKRQEIERYAMCFGEGSTRWG